MAKYKLYEQSRKDVGEGTDCKSAPAGESGTTLDFSSLSISVSGPAIYLNEAIVTGGDIQHSDKVLSQAGGGNFSGMMYTINVGVSQGSNFTWVHHNIFGGSYPYINRVHIEGYRLAGFLTYQFTGKYRQQTEAIPGYR